jgi:hypothetical protein
MGDNWISPSTDFTASVVVVGVVVVASPRFFASSLRKLGMLIEPPMNIEALPKVQLESVAQQQPTHAGRAAIARDLFTTAHEGGIEKAKDVEFVGDKSRVGEETARKSLVNVAHVERDEAHVLAPRNVRERGSPRANDWRDSGIWNSMYETRGWVEFRTCRNQMPTRRPKWSPHRKTIAGKGGGFLLTRRLAFFARPTPAKSAASSDCCSDAKGFMPRI